MSVKVHLTKKNEFKENLEQFSKEELIQRIRALEAHNIQLQNIINKSNIVIKSAKIKRSFDFSKCKFRHILLHVFYLGWDYRGFSVQEDTINTIEYYLFQALKKTCLIKDRTCSNYNRCGRTDKGVSSFGQVISIDVRSKLTEDTMNDTENEIDYCKLLNKVLPSNIQCVAWAPCEETDFSARFNCSARTYKYYFPKGKLNINKMRNAGLNLIGSHDFRNFAKMDVGNGIVEFIRNIIDFKIEPCIESHISDENTDEYSMYVVEIKGNAFLWHQIRYIMGILFLIGAGKEEPAIIKNLLNISENPRKPDYNMANEIPLCLFNCEYPNIKDWTMSEESLKMVVDKLQQFWTFQNIKVTMAKDMLDHLSTHIREPINNTKCLTQNLLDGVRSKNYIPVMKRPKCDSLEAKIAYYSKRKRIEIVDESETPLIKKEN